MAVPDTTNSLTLMRTPDDVIHCDWRLTVHGCAESQFMIYVYIINAALSGLAVILGSGVLAHRMLFLGHTLLQPRRAIGFLRPRSTECLLLLLTIFNALRFGDSILVLTDSTASNAARSFLFEISWQCGFSGIALYWVGIVQTLPETHKVSRTWLPTAAQVDVMGCFLVFGPMLTNNICSILAGHFGDIGNLQMAQMFIRLHYACWTIFDTTLAVSLIYFGTRLTTVLRDHLNNVNVLGSRRARILRLGLFKIQIVLVSVAACLIAFAGMLLSYCLWRKEIHTITPVSLFVGTCWTLTAVFMSLAVFISTLLRNSRDASPEAPEVSQSTESRSTHQPPSSTASSDKTTEGHEHVVTIPDEKAGRDAPEDRSHSLSPICWMPTRPQVAPSGRRGSKSSGIELVQQRPESQTSDDDLPGQV